MHGIHTMRSLVAAVLALNLVTPYPVHAQTKSDESAIRNVPQAFCDAWNRHDGHALAQRFKQSTIASLQTAIKFLRPSPSCIGAGGLRAIGTPTTRLADLDTE